MPSKELTKAVATELAKVHSRKGSTYEDMAQAAISTILAALQEPTENMLHEVEGMLVSGPYLGMLDAADIWERLLAAALGEQAE
ncbi:hypothetical protein JS562_37715 [Agrobacterium sp. S2]|nr:hypothetical protein [Agrobacterium sp. S2]